MAGRLSGGVSRIEGMMWPPRMTTLGDMLDEEVDDDDDEELLSESILLGG